MKYVGQGVDRVDGHLKVTGQAPYAGDTSLPRMAHAVLVLSTVPSGRIVGLDVSDAERLPGVLRVMTHLNTAKLPSEGRAAAADPPTGRVLTLLQDEVVHFNRQPIALVVAETLDQATAAAARVKATYATDAARLSFADGRARAHAPAKVNRDATDSLRGNAGQVDASRVAAKMGAIYSTPMEHHNAMEPHATVALWQGDKLTVYDATQAISGCQNSLAKTLGIPRENVRVVCPYVGGGFGSKGSMWSHVPLAALAARQVGRPVKLVLQRPQMFGPVGGRPQTEQSVAVTAASDGELLSMRHDSLSHTSLLEDFTEPAAVQTRVLYACPNVATTHRLVQLNAMTPTFQRAPGHATGTFALESALDELAHELKMDPVALRRRNEPATDEDKRIPWSSRSVLACYDSGAQAFNWAARSPAPKSMRDGRDFVGLGFATATYPANRAPAGAIARLRPDGVVVVQCGTQELGTGMYTVMTQVAADILGFPLDRVRFELGDSTFPVAPVSGGSQSTASVAPAVQAAATALREKIIALAVADEASPAFDAPVGDVIIESGSIGRRTTARREPVAAALARNGGREISARGDAQQGEEKKQFSMHSFGAVFVEVRVDAELGVIRVPRVVGRYSVGKLLNAKTGRSQLLGGVVWGIGMALMEESLFDPRDGRIVNANLADYHVPTHADIGTIDVDVVPEDDPYINALGARGIGEIGITGVAAALANAIHHATGVRVRELPITLDKLLV